MIILEEVFVKSIFGGSWEKLCLLGKNESCKVVFEYPDLGNMTLQEPYYLPSPICHTLQNYQALVISSCKPINTLLVDWLLAVIYNCKWVMESL